jgi:hypothetical protein
MPTPEELRTVRGVKAGRPVAEITRASGLVEVFSNRTRFVSEPRGSLVRLAGQTRAELRAALVVADMRTEAAIALIESIVDIVEDYKLRMVLVSDVVAHWQKLGADGQATYRLENTSTTPLQRFVWDYIEQVDEAAFAGIPDDQDMIQEEAEEIRRRGWFRHLATIQGQPEGVVQP